MLRILVTGGAGFVGQAVCDRLRLEDAYDFVQVVRRLVVPESLAGANCLEIGDIDEETDWSQALSGVDVVVHTAARVHDMSTTAADQYSAYLKTNSDSTLNLARQAAAVGVKRFIFLSTIKVNGEFTLPGAPFTEQDNPRPQGAYAVSKLKAENGLQQVGRDTGMEIVILRPPLVYGPGVKANFHTMIQWVSRHIPLPLGAISNSRSLIALDNLVDFIITCIDHPAAANQVFLVSDGDDMSTTELLQRVSSALGGSIMLIPVPESVLIMFGRITGKTETFQRLIYSLQVDISKSRKMLGWVPPVSVSEGLSRTVEAYLR